MSAGVHAVVLVLGVLIVLVGKVSFDSLPGVEVILTTSDLCRRWMTSIQELLNYLVNVQDPSHQAVHLLVQTLKPTTKDIVGMRQSAGI